LLKDEYHFLENLDYDHIKLFRKRVVGLILATDMAKHMEDLKTFKAKCESRGVTLLDDNVEQFIERNDEGRPKWEDQQDLLEILQHAADVSPPTRPF